MNCSLNAFREAFPELGSSDTALIQRNTNEVVNWVNVANAQARSQGFYDPLYTIKYKDAFIEMPDGSYADNPNKIAMVEIHKENLDNYTQFIEDMVSDDLKLGQVAYDDYREINRANTRDGAIPNPYRYVTSELLYAGVENFPDDGFESTENIDPEDPANFAEWVSLRKTLLKDLKDRRKYKMSQKASKEELHQINLSIFYLEKELSEVDEESVYVIHSQVIGEINNLHKLIEMASDDNINPILAANTFDNNKVFDRIKDLKTILNSASDSEGETYVNFEKGLKESELLSLKGALGRLEDNFNASLNKIIANIALNNEFMVQLKENINNSTNEEKKAELVKLEEVVQALLDSENKEFNIDGESGITEYIFGARSYDSLLAEVVIIIRDLNQTKESGQTLSARRVLEKSYEKLVNKKSIFKGKEIFFMDKVWAKDEFGQKLPYLISPFSKIFHQRKKQLEIFEEDFTLAEKDSEEQIDAYKNWMENMASMGDFLEPYRLPVFAKAYRNHPDFKEFFTYTDQEMAEYEAEMIQKLGKVAYEMEVKNIQRGIDNFEMDGFLNKLDKDNKNPFRFINHFYTEEYINYDERGEYVLPTYTSLIPRVGNDTLYNEDFKNLEQEGGQDFADFYSSASELLIYSNQIFEAEGIKVDLHHIINMQDNFNREIVNQTGAYEGKIFGPLLNAGKNIIRIAGATGKSLVSAWYEGGHEKDPTDREHIKTHYNDYGNREYSELRKAYERKEVNDLLDMLEERGLKLPKKYLKEIEKYNTPPVEDPSKTEEENEAILKRFTRNKNRSLNKIRGILSEAIARNDINKSSSLDLFKRISYATTLAESIATRSNTIGTLELVKTYAKSEKVNAVNFSKYITTWEANNIIQPGSLTHTKLGKLESYQIPLPKWAKQYSEAEKLLRKVWEEERKNIESEDIINFTDDKGDIYETRTEEGKLNYYLLTGGVEKRLKLEEIQKKYEEYLEYKINNLGNTITPGRIIGGLLWNMYKHYMYLKALGGFNNRNQGKMQNNQAAAAGIYGFTPDNLYNARVFITGMGTNKLLGYPGSVITKYIPSASKYGTKNIKRVQQWEILFHIATNMGLLSNVVQDVSGGDGKDVSLGSGALDKWKEFAGDYAMNIPEMKNQMELLVAMMQNYTIKGVDENGNEVETPLFDPKTMTFPFDPQTMKLKPPFDTPENKLNWENFKPDQNGKSPQDVLIQSYQSTRDKLHGNYRTTDKVAIQSTFAGRGVSAFMKWFYENANNQYGTKKVSLTTASVNVKGRKIVIGQKFPVLATHLFLNNVGLVTTASGTIGAITAAASGASLVGITAGAILSFPVFAGITTAGFIFYRMRSANIERTYAKADLSLALQYAKEIALRTLKSTANSVTLGQARNVLYSEESIKKWTKSNRELYKDRNLSFKERQIMSESAQEIADKYNIYIQTAMAGIALKFMFSLLVALNGGEDEEELKKLSATEREEKKFKHLQLLERYEGTYKYFLNVRNNLAGDATKWTNPAAFADTASTLVFFEWIQKVGKQIMGGEEKLKNGLDTPVEKRLENVAMGLGVGLFGIPKSTMDYFDPKKKVLFADRVFDFNGAGIKEVDNLLLDAHKSEDVKVSKSLKENRKRLREDLKEIYTEKLREEGVAEWALEDLVKKNVDKYMKDAKVYKKKTKKINRTEKSIMEKTNWVELTEKARESKLKVKPKESQLDK